MTRRVFEKLCTKKVCVDFLAPIFSEKTGIFSEKGGGNSVNEGLGKDFYRKGNAVKRFGPFTEPPDSEN